MTQCSDSRGDGYTGASLSEYSQAPESEDRVGHLPPPCRQALHRGLSLPDGLCQRDVLLGSDPAAIASQSEVVFLATPHGVSAPLAADLSPGTRSLPVIDLSADFP